MKNSGIRAVLQLPAKILAVALMIVLFPPPPVFGGAPLSVHEAVREYIEAHMPWPQGTMRMEFTTAEPSPISGRHAATLRVEAAGAGDFIGDAAFIVRVFSGGSLLHTETVRAHIEVLRDVVVAARTIHTRSIVTSEDVRLVRKWVRRSMPDALSGVEGAIGKQALLQIRSGTELSARMLKDAPLVRKGRLVRVLFDNGWMQISTVGIPEEDGTAGSTIRIRNVTSNKIIHARVLGTSLVGVGI